MSPSEHSPSSQVALVLAGLGAVALVVFLYLLSVGPVAAYCETRSGAMCEGLRTFYAPLRWLHDATPLERPLEWYVELFQ